MDGYISVGFGQGGSQLASVTGGQNYEIKAGSGLYLITGVLIPVSETEPHRFEAQIGVGYMERKDSGEGKSTVTWSRMPIEAIYFYRNTEENFRIGMGFIYNANNKITAKGNDLTAAMAVDDARGWLFAADYLTQNPYPNRENMFSGVGLRYNSIRYSSSGFSADVSGESWYVTLSGLF